MFVLYKASFSFNKKREHAPRAPPLDRTHKVGVRIVKEGRVFGIVFKVLSLTYLFIYLFFQNQFAVFM